MTLKTYTKNFLIIFRLAYPIIIGMLGHTVVGIVDNVMVGQLGPEELAAVSLGNSFIFIAMSLGIGFSTAITPLWQKQMEKIQIEKGRSAFHNGLYSCVHSWNYFVFTHLLLPNPYSLYGTTYRGGGISKTLFRYCCLFIDSVNYVSSI